LAVKAGTVAWEGAARMAALVETVATARTMPMAALEALEERAVKRAAAGVEATLAI
jgi:hypothetical protein